MGTTKLMEHSCFFFISESRKYFPFNSFASAKITTKRLPMLRQNQVAQIAQLSSLGLLPVPNY